MGDTSIIYECFHLFISKLNRDIEKSYKINCLREHLIGQEINCCKPSEAPPCVTSYA
jgi:hypothetical protein